MQRSPKIFSGTGSQYLAERISHKFGIPLGKITISRFSDGEIQPVFQESIRGDMVFLVQSTFSPAENIMELLLMIDAARRASAYKVVAVIPYYGYARQDRKDKPRVAIGSKLIANMFEATSARRSFLNAPLCFITKASATSKPILCRVPAYSRPIFPNPAMRYPDMV